MTIVSMYTFTPVLYIILHYYSFDPEPIIFYNLFS